MPRDEPQDGANHVVLEVHGREIPISLADGEAMKQALLDYFERSRENVAEETVDRLRGSIPRLDSDGTLRIGLWLLEVRPTGLVLTKRDRMPNHFVFATAELEKTGADWRVTHVGTEHVPLLR